MESRAQEGEGGVRKRRSFLYMNFSQPETPAKIFGSPLTKRLESEVTRLASTPKTTVSLHGELGVGKQTWARRLHAKSARKEGPFVALGAGEHLAAEVIASAVGGTLYLSDVTDLGAEEQQLLSALLAGRLESVAREPGIRVIAAAREDLEEAVNAGRLREDLEYRLNVLAVEIAPLRERVEEILAYAQYFLGSFGRRMRLATPDLSPDAEAALLGHRWEGNLHELKAVMERAFFGFSGANVLVTSATLGLDSGYKGEGGDLEAPGEAFGSLSLDVLEEQAVRRALAQSDGNRSLAARHLGIHRTTLYHKMRRFGLR